MYLIRRFHRGFLPSQSRLAVLLLFLGLGLPALGGAEILTNDKLITYVDWFNAVDDEPYKQAVPDAQAYEFLEANLSALKRRNIPNE